MNHLRVTGCRAAASGLVGLSDRWSAPGGRVAAILAAAALVLAGCAGQASRDAEGGGDYRRLDPDRIPDAVPRVEPRSKYGNMASYRVRGRVYRTKTEARGHLEYGLASWYGRQFNGQRTSSGERYDMYAMTAAHKTLPLPSYARVTNLENGRSTVVRINDRGPFHSTRIIDLSYAAATKIGVVPKGTASVEIRGLDPSLPDAAAPASGAGTTAPAAAAPAPFLADARGGGDLNPTQETALARSLAIAARGSAPAVRPAARSVPLRERAASAAFAAVDAEPVPAPDARAGSGSRPAVLAAAATPRGPAPAAGVAAGGGAALYLQVGAFGDPRNAERLRERLRPHLALEVRVQSPDGGAAELYKVRVGPLASEGEARQLSAKLASLGVSETPRLIWN